MPINKNEQSKNNDISEFISDLEKNFDIIGYNTKYLDKKFDYNPTVSLYFNNIVEFIGNLSVFESYIKNIKSKINLININDLNILEQINNKNLNDIRNFIKYLNNIERYFKYIKKEKKGFSEYDKTNPGIKFIKDKNNKFENLTLRDWITYIEIFTYNNLDFKIIFGQNTIDSFMLNIKEKDINEFLDKKIIEIIIDEVSTNDIVGKNLEISLSKEFKNYGEKLGN